MSTPTPEEAFLEYARATGWEETAVRVVLDTIRKARRVAALEMRERSAAVADAAAERNWRGDDSGTAPEHIAAVVRALNVP
jgi:hypothetical protein